ncbi:MAG: ATP-binding protein [Acidimicrobiales bacterium]
MTSATIVLPPESASVPQARRFVADHLSDLPSETVDTARLLVSEVVTNAVLHARTELSLTLMRDPSKVSVEVADSNPLLPVLRTHGADAGTGRGLHVLDKMATRWGANQTDGGKVVWFEIRTEAADGSGDKDPETPADGANGDMPSELNDPRRARGTGEIEPDADATLIDFRWIGLPVALLIATGQHYDAVLREFHLVLEREPEERAALPGRFIALMDELTNFGPLMSSVEQDLERGRQSGAQNVDVMLELPREVGPMALRLDNLLDEADAYCAAGVDLLSLEPSNDVVSLRKWLIGELARQAEGHDAVAWADSPWATSAPPRPTDRYENK